LDAWACYGAPSRHPASTPSSEVSTPGPYRKHALQDNFSPSRQRDLFRNFFRADSATPEARAAGHLLANPPALLLFRAGSATPESRAAGHLLANPPFPPWPTRRPRKHALRGTSSPTRQHDHFPPGRLGGAGSTCCGASSSPSRQHALSAGSYIRHQQQGHFGQSQFTTTPLHGGKNDDRPHFIQAAVFIQLQTRSSQTLAPAPTQNHSSSSPSITSSPSSFNATTVHPTPTRPQFTSDNSAFQISTLDTSAISLW
jgi:hypothetical protein